MIVLTGTSSMPVFATVDQGYGPGNVRPAWVDDMPDPDQELERFLNMEV